METIKVLSIDIGIINLGYVYASVVINETSESRHKATILNENYLLNKSDCLRDIEIIDCNRIDITKVKHHKVAYNLCKLHHDRCIPDYLDHFIQELPYFEECDVLLLERQPPVGITNVQDLLFKQFRDKVVMVSPSSVHKYFDLPSGHTDLYELRKIKSESLSRDFLGLKLNFNNNTRRHDIADAMLMIIYYYKTRRELLITTKNYNKVCHTFEQFRLNV